ncbi:MAG: energy-coupling factor transporter ATPase [Faecousia sp.]
MAATIEVRNLSHTYSVGTPFQHDAVKHLNFTVERGEFLGIIGHTGSGKSTLIQHLNGLLKPTEGDVLLDGESIWKDKLTTRAARFRVGLVFQYPEYQLFEDTVFQDIAFGPKNMGLKEDEIRQRVLRAADFAGVNPDVLDKSPFDLSGGQKRRVAIAGVIAMEPEVVIFDEPTAGLDPAGCASLLENIRTYRQATGATILMVSHSMDDVARLADRLLVLNEGQVEMLGKPAEIFAQAKRLQEIGLSVPQVTSLFLRLRELGTPVNPATYTVEDALEQLLRLKGGGRRA